MSYAFLTYSCKVLIFRYIFWLLLSKRAHLNGSSKKRAHWQKTLGRQTNPCLTLLPPTITPLPLHHPFCPPQWFNQLTCNVWLTSELTIFVSCVCNRFRSLLLSRGSRAKPLNSEYKLTKLILQSECPS